MCIESKDELVKRGLDENNIFNPLNAAPERFLKQLEVGLS